MAEEGSRRVKLDLSDFVLDVGSHRWLLLVPGAMVTVGDLLTRLRGEYEQVEEGDGLTVFLDGQYMVPPWEPLAILREGDQLRITLSKAGRAGRPPAAKRRRVEEVQVKAASKRSKVEQAKAKVEEVAKSKPKKKESSSESSSEEEVTKPEVNKHEVKQVASKKPVVAKESSSSSSEEEEETKSKQQPVPKKAAAKESSSSSSSSEEEATTVEPKQQVKTVSKESSSSDSSSSEEEVKSAEMKQVQVQQQKAAEASSSSDSSGEETTKAKEKPLQNGVAEAAPAPGPPKRKRKRKPRNRNKLPADQMPDFGPPIQALPEFVAKPETSRENMHRRFGEKEEAEEEDEEEEGEMSAEAMQELYKQSVAYANRGPATGTATGKLLQPSYMPALASPKPAQPSSKPAQPSPKPAQPSPKPPAKQPLARQAQPSPKPPAKQPLARAAQPSSNGASCEEALLAAQDQRATTNGAAASRAAPRVVFRPRAIDVSKIRTEQPSPGLQLSTAGSEAAAASLLASPAAAEAKGNQEKVEESGVENGKEAAKKNGLAVEGMEALLSCRGKVFDRSVDRPMARDYSSLTPLQGPPGIGAVLAYRVMELGADYTPGMSQYKEGRVVQVSGQQVTLELQAGASTRVGGRFSMVEEEVEVERVVTLTLGELIQPLLVA